MMQIYTGSSDLMDRIYLSVSPEEYPEVKASGASWDDASKTWYIGEGVSPAPFSRWLGDNQDDGTFGIASEEAFVASAQSCCVKCGKDIEVVCVYCKTGVDTESGDPMSDFTVSNVWAVDDALGKALQRWPHYRMTVVEHVEDGSFANHCPHCGAVQEDYLLHSEPGDVFFGMVMGRPGPVEFTPLDRPVQLSGDYGFEV